MSRKKCLSINAANYTEKPVGWYIIIIKVNIIKIITFICVQMFKLHIRQF